MKIKSFFPWDSLISVITIIFNAKFGYWPYYAWKKI